MNDKGFYISYICVFLGIFAPGFNLLAQTDTTLLKPHVVTSRSQESLTGSGVCHIDSMQTTLMKHGTLADLLSTATPAVIRYYGPGQLSTSAIRGASASQTLVTWNGMRINHPMLSQTDLGSIPAGIITSAALRTGSSTLKTGSGAFGGVIDINSHLTDTLAPVMEAGYSTGTYGYHRFSGTVRFHKKRYLSATYIYDERAENDFRYLDNFQPGRPYLQRINANTHLRGLMHHSGSTFGSTGYGEVMVWAHQRQIAIPYPIHQPQGKYDQHQAEENIRVMWHARARHRGMLLSSATGVQHGRMQYVDSRSNTDALHIASGIQQRVSAEGRLRLARWETHADYELQHVNTSAYQGITTRHIAALFNQLLLPVSQQGWLGVVQRLEYVPGYGTHWMPALMIGFIPKSSPSNILKINLMKNRQLPGLNDLYWVPGGNPQLRPETGLVFEGTWEYQHQVNQAEISIRITGFHQRVEEKIVWLPDSGAIWAAFNLERVRMEGGEFNITLAQTSGRYRLQWNGLAQITRAMRRDVDDDVLDKQLIYIPLISGASIARIATPWCILSVNTMITGKRFTNIQNSSWMPSFAVTNIYLTSNAIPIGRLTINAHVTLLNVFNANYQMMAWYPMPRRMLRVGVNVGRVK